MCVHSVVQAYSEGSNALAAASAAMVFTCYVWVTQLTDFAPCFDRFSPPRFLSELDGAVPAGAEVCLTCAQTDR
jgi:hypothetical protein